MKTFQEFLSEDAASDTSSTISRDVSGGGGQTPEGVGRGKQFSVLDLLKRKKKDKDDNQDQKTSQQKPDGPGKQPDRKPLTYRKFKNSTKKTTPYRPVQNLKVLFHRERERTPSSGSMVQKKTAHKTTTTTQTDLCKTGIYCNRR